MRLRRQDNTEWVASMNFPAGQHNSHNAGFPNKISLGVAFQHCRRQARQEIVKLSAGVPQSRHFHHDLCPKFEPRSGRQSEQVNPARRAGLARLPRRHVKPGGPKRIKQLCVDEMHLAQVRLAGVFRDPRAMLDGSA